jgi:hypothetical protein
MSTWPTQDQIVAAAEMVALQELTLAPPGTALEQAQRSAQAFAREILGLRKRLDKAHEENATLTRTLLHAQPDGLRAVVLRLQEELEVCRAACRKPQYSTEAIDALRQKFDRHSHEWGLCEADFMAAFSSRVPL